MSDELKPILKSGKALKELIRFANRQAGRPEDYTGPGEWMTIESAPKDGTAILVCGGLMPEPFVAEWDDRQQYWKSTACIEQYYGSRDATHWMPLPDPPFE